jgi:hypothetical protein
MSEFPAPALLIIALGVALAWDARMSVKSGASGYMVIRVKRDASPLQFWFYIGVRALSALVLTVLGILDLSGVRVLPL